MRRVRCWRIALLSLPVALLLTPVALLFAASEHGVKVKIAEATAPFDNGAVNAAITLPDGVVRAQIDIPGAPFWVKPRKEQIERFPCTPCHTGKEKLIKVNDGAELAHGDIRFKHGGQSSTCTICHSEKERDFLVNKAGDKIDFDHSYQLCGQCHFRQQKDWAGGAHGKRDVHWAGQRVVWNCTSCHDPHAPRFEKRWPKTYSRSLNE